MNLDRTIQFCKISSVHFEHENAHAPYIYLFVLTHAVSNLWRHVVTASATGRAVPNLQIGNPGHSEVDKVDVGDLVSFIVVYHDVAWLHVTVVNAVLIDRD
jgi:hypothetical protein